MSEYPSRTKPKRDKQFIAQEERWGEIAAWRAKLLDPDEDFPSLNRFRTKWAALHETGGAYLGDREFEMNMEPFEFIMESIEAGYYPPPEHLLWMVDQWHAYLDGAGEKSMEEVFLGRPVRGAGKFAERWDNLAKDYQLIAELAALVQDGLSPERAAEKLIDKHQIRRKNGKGALIEPTSLLRRFRQYGVSQIMFGKKKPA